MIVTVVFKTYYEVPFHFDKSVPHLSALGLPSSRRRPSSHIQKVIKSDYLCQLFLPLRSTPAPTSS